MDRVYFSFREHIVAMDCVTTFEPLDERPKLANQTIGGAFPGGKSTGEKEGESRHASTKSTSYPGAHPGSDWTRRGSFASGSSSSGDSVSRVHRDPVEWGFVSGSRASRPRPPRPARWSRVGRPAMGRAPRPHRFRRPRGRIGTVTFPACRVSFFIINKNGTEFTLHLYCIHTAFHTTLWIKMARNSHYIHTTFILHPYCVSYFIIDKNNTKFNGYFHVESALKLFWSRKKLLWTVQSKVLALKRYLSWNRGVPMASRRGQILLAVVYSMSVLPVRLAIVSTLVPFQPKDFSF